MLVTATTRVHLPKSVSTNLTVKSDLTNPIWSSRLVDVICFCSLHVVVLIFLPSCGIVSYASLKFSILIQRVQCLLYAYFNAVFLSIICLTSFQHYHLRINVSTYINYLNAYLQWAILEKFGNNHTFIWNSPRCCQNLKGNIKFNLNRKQLPMNHEFKLF